MHVVVSIEEFGDFLKYFDFEDLTCLINARLIRFVLGLLVIFLFLKHPDPIIIKPCIYFFIKRYQNQDGSLHH